MPGPALRRVLLQRLAKLIQQRERCLIPSEHIREGIEVWRDVAAASHAQQQGETILCHADLEHQVGQPLECRGRMHGGRPRSQALRTGERLAAPLREQRQRLRDERVQLVGRSEGLTRDFPLHGALEAIELGALLPLDFRRRPRRPLIDDERQDRSPRFPGRPVFQLGDAALAVRRYVAVAVGDDQQQHVRLPDATDRNLRRFAFISRPEHHVVGRAGHPLHRAERGFPVLFEILEGRRDEHPHRRSPGSPIRRGPGRPQGRGRRPTGRGVAASYRVPHRGERSDPRRPTLTEEGPAGSVVPDRRTVVICRRLPPR